MTTKSLTQDDLDESIRRFGRHNERVSQEHAHQEWLDVQRERATKRCRNCGRTEGSEDTRAAIWHPSCPEVHDEGGRQGFRA